MSAITGDETDPQALDETSPDPSGGIPSRRIELDMSRPVFRWMTGLAAVVIVLIVCLLAWGMEIEFPTTVSSFELPTSDGRAIMVTTSVRDVTGRAIDDAVKWTTKEGSWLFDGVSVAIAHILINIEKELKWLPWPTVVAGLALISFAAGRWPLLVFTPLALLFVGFMGLWDRMIETVTLTVVAVALCVCAGFPLGVLGARSKIVDNLMRPILDGMQTMPSFVYLLPGVLFFGLGKPAGIFATVIYAVPPVIRLTSLGIRQVSPEVMEAARVFGASPLQLLTKVQVPIALPTIMAGISQTTMMALGMVTVASMVAAGGLGDNVYRALQNNELGNGAIAGLSIVFLAIILVRLTQAAVRNREETLRSD